MYRNWKVLNFTGKVPAHTACSLLTAWNVTSRLQDRRSRSPVSESSSLRMEDSSLDADARLHPSPVARGLSDAGSHSPQMGRMVASRGLSRRGAMYRNWKVLDFTGEVPAPPACSFQTPPDESAAAAGAAHGVLKSSVFESRRF
jgi:hypothetical protein